MNKFIKIYIVSCLLFFTLYAQSKEVFTTFEKKWITPDSIQFIPKEHPNIKIGVVFSGGGTRGIAHIALLKNLENCGIPVHYISGTSIGALVGSLYACGYSPDDIVKIVYGFNWKSLYSDKKDRRNIIVPQKEDKGNYIIKMRFDQNGPYLPSALTYGQNVLSYLTSNTAFSTFHHHNNYNNLNVGLNIIATDILSGKKIVFKKGNIAKNILASMAFPLLFSPVEHDSYLLVDGGISSNIPVEEVEKMGATFILANDVTASLRDKKNLKLPWEIADQVTTIMARSILDKNHSLADIVFSPPLKQMSSNSLLPYSQLAKIENNEFKKRKSEIIKKINSKFLTSFSIDSINIKVLEIDIYKNGRLFSHIYQNYDTSVCLNNLYFIWKRKYCFDKINLSFQSLKKKLYAKLEYNNKEIKIISKDSLLNVLTNNFLAKESYLQFSKKKFVQKKIKSYLNKLGYFACNVKIEKSNIYNSADRLIITSGKIDKVIVEGNIKTKEHIIKRELDPQLFIKAHINSLDNSIKNLYGTGLFHLVELYPYKNNGESVLKIVVKEKPFFSAGLGLKYTSERHTEAKISFFEENLLGRKINWISEFIIGSYRRKASVTFKSDRIYKTDISAFLKWNIGNTKYPVYDKEEKVKEFSQSLQQLELGVGKNVERLGFVAISGIYENIIGPENNFAQNNKLFRSWGIKLNSIIDKRNKYPYPDFGEYIKWGWESYNQLLPVKLNSTKAWIKGIIYKKIAKYSVVSFFTNNGIAENTLPFVKWFRPVEGLEKNGWHDFQYYGKMYVVFGTELRQKVFPHFWGEKYLSLKYDFGKHWKSSEEKFQWNDMESGLSFGVMFETIAGPIEFRYEISENRKPFYRTKFGFNF